MEEDFLDTNKLFEIFCYTLSCALEKRKQTKFKSRPLLPSSLLKEKVLVNYFILPVCLVKIFQKMLHVRNCLRNVAKLMAESNKKRMVTNLDNVIKNFPSDRELLVFREKQNDLSECTVDLNLCFYF